MLETIETPSASSTIFRHRGVFDRAELKVTYSVDWSEHKSRLTTGICAIADEFILAALLSIPEGRIGKVNSRFEKVLQETSTSSIATVITDPDGGMWAQRHVRPTVDVVNIEIEAPSLRLGCSAAQRWAGYGPRTVHTSAKASTYELTEAAHYGVGFVTHEGEHLLAPETFVSKRWSSARWRFAELTYAQFLDQLR